jgi:hypothetical protein
VCGSSLLSSSLPTSFDISLIASTSRSSPPMSGFRSRLRGLVRSGQEC